MSYPVKLEGFENRQISLKPAGFFTPAKLLIEGQPAPKGPKPRQFVLQRSDGGETIVQLHRSFFSLLDPVPQLRIDNKVISVATPLKWYELIWIAWPILLVFWGGAVGGLLGALALVTNFRVFRSDKSSVFKYTASGVISLLAITFYLGLVISFQLILAKVGS